MAGQRAGPTLDQAVTARDRRAAAALVAALRLDLLLPAAFAAGTAIGPRAGSAAAPPRGGSAAGLRRVCGGSANEIDLDAVVGRPEATDTPGIPEPWVGQDLVDGLSDQRLDRFTAVRGPVGER